MRKKVKLFGTREKDIDITWLDFYSIGHILFGYINYTVSMFIIFMFGVVNFREYSLSAAICLGILWEIVENSKLLDTKLKYKNRKDSLENSLADIIMVSIGSVIAHVLSYFDFEIFFIGSLVACIFLFIAYDICGKITINRKHNEKRNS